jgi:hypothetical protein
MIRFSGLVARIALLYKSLMFAAKQPNTADVCIDHYHKTILPRLLLSLP